MQQSSRERRTRLITFAAVAATSVSMFVALGGAELAHSAISLVQYQYGKKVLICHKGKHTIKVSSRAWPAHKRHGDTEGACVKKKHGKEHHDGDHGSSAQSEHGKSEHGNSEKGKGEKGKSEKGKGEHGSKAPKQESVGSQGSGAASFTGTSTGSGSGSGERGGKGQGGGNGRDGGHGGGHGGGGRD